MTRRFGMRGVGVWMAASILLALAAETVAADSPTAANKLAGLDTALRLVPDSAGFYTSLLRGRQQLDAVLKSRAWAKIKQMPAVQMGMAFYQMQASVPDSVPGKIQRVLEDPQVKEALALLGDMFSHEVFLYGDLSAIELLELSQQLQRGNQVGQIMGQLGGSGGQKAQAQMLLKVLAENADRVKAPNLVFGFKLANRQRAVEQLAKLELILGILLQSNPRTNDALKRTTVGGHEYLVTTLTGQMIPWDQVPMDELKKQVSSPADVDKLVAQLKKQKLAITLGIRENYLIFALGPNTDGVAALGQGKRLVDRAEWKRLDWLAGKTITQLTFLSQAVRARLLANQANFDAMIEQVEEVLPAVGLKQDQQQRIAKDLKGLATDLKAYMPKLGAAVGLGFLTTNGSEAYGYQWDVYRGTVDATQPLGLLEHLGGNPLLGLVVRGKSSPANYDLLVRWLGVAWRYVDDFGVPQMSEDDRQHFKKFVEQVRPLLRRIDEVNRTMLIPALADGQFGLVLDAKLKSKQFLRDLPATEKPMPMVEPALVFGVSDPALLRKAAGEYARFVQGVLDALDDASPSPEAVLKLPKPKVTNSADGEMASYPLPAEWGVDRQVAPTFALSNKVAVITSSAAEAQRLLQPTPLAAGGVLADAKRPRAMAVVCNWAATVDAATPWVEFALEQAGGALGEQQKMISEQVRSVLEVLKVFRSATSERYLDGGVVVEHARAEFRDLP